jgi:hypothetical protein
LLRKGVEKSPHTFRLDTDMVLGLHIDTDDVEKLPVEQFMGLYITICDVDIVIKSWSKCWNLCLFTVEFKTL